MPMCLCELLMSICSSDFPMVNMPQHRASVTTARCGWTGLLFPVEFFILRNPPIFLIFSHNNPMFRKRWLSNPPECFPTNLGSVGPYFRTTTSTRGSGKAALHDWISRKNPGPGTTWPIPWSLGCQGTRGRWKDWGVELGGFFPCQESFKWIWKCLGTPPKMG